MILKGKKFKKEAEELKKEFLDAIVDFDENYTIGVTPDKTSGITLKIYNRLNVIYSKRKIDLMIMKKFLEIVPNTGVSPLIYNQIKLKVDEIAVLCYKESIQVKYFGGQRAAQIARIKMHGKTL
ncbi:hypothetical protein [Priestia aryabhattai]